MKNSIYLNKLLSEFAAIPISFDLANRVMDCFYHVANTMMSGYPEDIEELAIELEEFIKGKETL